MPATLMPASLYMDVHVPMSITRALRRRGFDILTFRLASIVLLH
jgi:hypothetical protein